jgi:hypothetical protein
MPATTAIDGSDGADFDAQRTYFKNLSSGGNVAPKTYCQKRVRKWGQEPGYCEVAVQLKDLDTVVPGVAGVTDSPVYQMQENDYAQILSDTGTLMSGVITEISPDIGLDKSIVKVEDLRYLLEGVQLVGSWWAKVGPTGGIDYRMGVKAHINKNNQPNCLWVDVNDDGKNVVPMFCPAFYGIIKGTGQSSTTDTGGTGYAAYTIPNPDDENQDTACYWTPKTFFRHIQFITSIAILSHVHDKFKPWYADGSVLPSTIIWPDTLVNAFSDFNQLDRKAFERVYHCTNINAIIDDLCKAAGPYALNMISNEDGTNTMQIVRTRYVAADAAVSFGSGSGPSADALKGHKLTRATGGIASDDMTGPTINSGSLRESSKNLYSLVLPVGDHAVIECRCASGLTHDATISGYVPLRWNYSEHDRTLLRDAILAYINGPDDPIFTGLMRDWLKGKMRASASLFCEYIIEPGFNFQAGTSQSDYPIATTNRDVLPHCLSSYFPSNAADEFARLNSRYSIPVENSDVADDSDWTTLQDANGLAIKGRGVISFRMLRDQDLDNYGGSVVFHGNTFSLEIGHSYPNYTVDKFEPKRFRISLAIPCDHRVVSPLQLPGLQNNDVPSIDAESDDSDRINFDQARRMLAIDTSGLAAFEERGGTYGGYPVPESLQDENGDNYPMAGANTVQAKALYGPDKILRDDSAYNEDHANRKLQEFGRLDRGGILKTDRLELAANVGDLIDQIDNTGGGTFPIKAAVKMIEDDFQTQKTTRTLV